MKKGISLILSIIMVVILCNITILADYTEELLLDTESEGEAGYWNYGIDSEYGISLMSASTVETYSKASQGNMKLSNNFTVKEFACKDGSDTVYIDSELVTILQNVRDHFNRAVTINSGYRTSTYNKKVGGATNSYHTKGMAADISVAGISPATVAAYAETIGVRGIGKYSSFVHLDTRPSKFYWKNSNVTHVGTFGGSYNSQPYGDVTIPHDSLNDPNGCIDSASGGVGTVRVSGWVFDYDAPNEATEVHIYVGGPAGSGAPGYPFTASGERADVAAVYGVGSNHGFDVTFNVDVSGEQTLYIYGINKGEGSNILIGTENVVIYDVGEVCDPKGCVDSASGGLGTVSVSGWTFDNDQTDTPLDIHVYVGGPAGSGAPGYNLGSASLSRPDVANAYGVNENHGFSFTFDVDVTGEKELYVYAINIGRGTNKCIGTATVNINDAYKECLDFINFENNKLMIQGWVLYKTGSNDIKVTYQIDDLPEAETERRSDNVVHNTYSDYPAGNERFYANIKGKDLSNGKHTVVVRAYADDKCISELGKKEFTSMNDHAPVKTIVNNNHVYSIFDVHMSWLEAETLAGNKGGHLATVTSSEEQMLVKELLEYGNSAQYWIGATNYGTDVSEDSKEWDWITGEKFDYTNWHEGEPNNGGGNEYYAGVYSNGTWNDFPENQKNIGYIMETEISGEPTDSISNNGHYYYLYDNEVDWYGAKAFCEAMGGHLVTIEDRKEQALVESLANAGSSDYAGYFIGLNDIDKDGKWSWITDEAVDYTNWNTNQPDNADELEYYGMMYHNGKWNDLQSYYGEGSIGFICEIEKDDTYTAKTEYNGNTYLRIDKSLSWEDAKAYCESLGGHLATIADEDEQETIEDLLCRGVDTLRSAYAIGGTDTDSEGNWKWITDEPFDYTNWDSGEPNDGGGSSKGSQNYLTIYSGSGMWDDNWNFNRNPYDIGFICEIEDNAVTNPEPTVTPEPIVVPEPDIATPKPEEITPKPDIDENLSTVSVGTVTAEVGETISVPISISNNKGICESKFVVQYDNTRLTPESVEIGEPFAGGTIQTNLESITAEQNELTITWENGSIADNTEIGDIFIVNFKVADDAAPGMIPITIDKDQIDVINANGEDVQINIVAGGVAIAWPVISVGNVNASIGSTVTVPIKIENNTGINAFGFTVEYDNQAIIPIEVSAGEVIEGKGNMQSNLDDTSIDWSAQTEVTATWLSDDMENNISDNGTLFNITFEIKDGIESGFYPVKIKYADGDITNALGAEIGVTTTSGGIAAKKVQIMYGDVNCDGKVNIIDIVLLRKKNANLPVEISDTGLKAADVNCDGKIDSRDILQLRKYVAKWNGIVLGK